MWQTDKNVTKESVDLRGERKSWCLSESAWEFGSQMRATVWSLVNSSPLTWVHYFLSPAGEVLLLSFWSQAYNECQCFFNLNWSVFFYNRKQLSASKNFSPHQHITSLWMWPSTLQWQREHQIEMPLVDCCISCSVMGYLQLNNTSMGKPLWVLPSLSFWILCTARCLGGSLSVIIRCVGKRKKSNWH